MLKRNFLSIILLVIFSVFVFSCKDKGPENSCLTGSNVPEEEMKNIQNAAADQMTFLLEKDYEKLYDNSGSSLKNAQNKDQFVMITRLFFTTYSNLDFPRIEEMYILNSKSKEMQVNIPCSLGEPGINDVYTMPSNQKFAIVLFSVRTDIEQVRVAMQLEQENEKWVLRSIEYHPVTIKNKMATYYIKKAQELREKNMLHSAVLYYKTAILLSEVGLNINEFTSTKLMEQVRLIKVDFLPDNVSGSAEEWQTEKGRYTVYNVDTAYENKKLLVHVSHVVNNLKDKEKNEEAAKDLTVFLDKKFPEYRKNFDGLRVTAVSVQQNEAMAMYHNTVLFEDIDK
jgi:hypothetical protein